MYVILYMLVAAQPITCKAKGAVTVTAEPGKGAKTKWPKAVFTVIDGDGKFAQLEGAKGTGWVKVSDLKKACGPKVLKEVTTAYTVKKKDKPPPTTPDEPTPASQPAATPVADKGSARLITIALVELKGPDRVTPELRESVRDAITASLKEHGSFSPMKPPSDAQVRLKECKDVACLAEVGRALGVDWIVTGTLNQVVKSYSLQLQLTNVRTAEAGQRVTRDYKGAPEGLADEARAAGKQLAEAVLNPQQPAPVASADAPRADPPPSEPAAKNDTAPVATTTTIVQPAPAGDDSKRSLYRGVGFTLTFVGAGVAAGGAVLMTLNMLTLSALQRASADYNANDVRPTVTYNALDQAWRTFDTRFVAGIAMMGFGLVSAVVGVTLLALAPKASGASALQLQVDASGALVRF